MLAVTPYPIIPFVPTGLLMQIILQRAASRGPLGRACIFSSIPYM